MFNKVNYTKTHTSTHWDHQLPIDQVNLINQYRYERVIIIIAIIYFLFLDHQIEVISSHTNINCRITIITHTHSHTYRQHKNSLVSFIINNIIFTYLHKAFPLTWFIARRFLFLCWAVFFPETLAMRHLTLSNIIYLLIIYE